MDETRRIEFPPEVQATEALLRLQAAAHGGDALLVAAADELAALRKDAERYRWLRDKGSNSWRPFVNQWHMAAELVDAAIDNEMAKESVREAAAEHARPSAVFKPRLSIDGDQWRALYGENLQDGVAGFGDSPADAMWDFDRAWGAKLPTRPSRSKADEVLRAHGFPELRTTNTQ